MEGKTLAICPPVTTSSHHDNDAKIIRNSSIVREEGELSAPENDEVAGSHFTGRTIFRGAPSNNVEMGSSALNHNPKRADVASRTSLHLKNHKSTEKNRVPFVISFSDEDSGSESEEYNEEYRRGNTIESDEVAKGVIENRKLSTSLANSQTVQQTSKTNIKMPKKLSTSRPVSSLNRVNGTFFKKGVAVKTHIKKSNPPSKNKFASNVHINSSKLQDLRQLIAIRENELKNESGKLDKEVTLSTIKSSTNTNLKNSVEPKEPEKKRYKASEPPTSALISVGKHDKPLSESTSGAKISTIEIDGRDKEIIGGTGQSSAIQQIKEAKKPNIPSTHPPSGSGVIKNNRRRKRNTNLVESASPLMGKKTDIISQSTQGSLNNSSFWNHFGSVNTSATGDMDIKSLLEVEELQDKELNDAQEYRRKCEIEERNALKAYRKAQRDLAEANTKCSYLYRKRELFSANLRSHVMDDSSMFWSNMNPATNMLENNMPPNEFHDLHEDGKKPDSETSTEPDTSETEPDEDEKTNDVCSSLHENTTSAEDDELKGSDYSHGEEISGDKRAEEVNNDLVTPDPTEDSLLLEATLRSQLFARLKIRTIKKNETGPATVEREDGEITEDTEIVVVPSDTDKDQLYDFGDTKRSNRSISEPVLRSAFGHVKFLAATQSQTDGNFDENRVYGVSGAQHTDLVANSSTFSLLDTYVGEVGSYSNNLPINPFWPLCMFELRGKCNDDECPMQHVRDYNRNDRTVSKCLDSLHVTPPTYLVCLDSLKSESHPYKYIVAQSFEKRWQKYFSAFLVVSSSIFADFHSDEPCLYGPETRIEVHGVWNRQSSYFHGKSDKEDQPEKHTDDTYQPIEIALYNLNREVNKQKGRKEALIVLARALEEHSTSVLLWIVYLHIYYSNQNAIGEDDMFYYAVKSNESSYELWLMFINSREKLDDRLLSYNTALSALCRHATALNKNHELHSECILDIYLQMLTFLCSCGQVNDAIQKAYTFFTKTSTDRNPPFLPELDTCLTIPDKSVLWVCCVYLIFYKKLPDTIVQQFECRKDLSTIEWPSVRLTPDEKMQANTLIELASEYFDTKSNQTKDGIKPAELFALNHIKCTAVLKRFDSCKNLLKKYVKLFPSCLELVLLSIRVNGVNSSESTCAAFEEVLTNWSGESGIQCIWNQYAEFLLENGKSDFAKEIMERWFTSISEFYHPKTKILNISAWIASLTQTDITFGLLNLALLKQLQHEHTEARIAIEQVMEIASFTDYKHCVKEHAMFSLRNGLGKARFDAFLNILNRYLTDARASLPSEPLSRSFIRSIGNPKTQKLVNSLLCPVSSDSSLLNLVLESCFGPSLLPFQASEKLTDVVDFAEALMELRPGNYRLALSICKNQSDSNASMSFWAGLQLIDSLFQAVPVAPESVWVEAASLLQKLAGFKSSLESFHKKALSVYPFSVMLWKSYLGLDANDTQKINSVIEMARVKGIKL